MIELNKIYNEDCLEGMKRIPDGSVDCIATDVPYRITSRGNAGSSGGMMQKDLSMKGKIFEDNDIKIEEYLPEFYRILKEKSHCYIMCNHINLTHFLKVIDESNFHFIKCLVWVKDNKIMGSFYMNQFEYIIMLRKGGAKNVNNCGISDVLMFANKKDKDKNGQNLHDSQKPVGLFQTLISQSSKKGETILDPFMGSGTTAIAAIREKRNFIGFEKSEEYWRKSMERIRNELSQQTLF